jgi:hypothetical protein
MMKSLTAAIVGCVMILGLPTTGAQAGVAELFFDDISTSCNQEVEPCRHNDLGYQTIYRHGRYLRYGINTSVLISPHGIYPANRHYRTHLIGGERLVWTRNAGRYRVVSAARYATVLRRVLVAPARNRVVRLRPHHAYLADTIIVKGGGCKRPLSWHSC